MSQLFVMPASPDAEEFLLEIAEEMQARFGISFGEAVARINAQWSGQTFLDPDPLIMHEMPEFWAMVIYYVDVLSWEPDADRSNWMVRPKPAMESGLWPSSG
jgi:hypothetical protein